jgi:hypothetical protein
MFDPNYILANESLYVGTRESRDVELLRAGARAILCDMEDEINENIRANPDTITTGPMLMQYIQRKLAVVGQEIEG